MTISGIPPYVPALPALPARPASSTAVVRSGTEAAASARTAGSGAVRGPSLWQVLTTEEKAFFLGSSTVSTLGYGANGSTVAGADPGVGRHLDVMA